MSASPALIRTRAEPFARPAADHPWGLPLFDGRLVEISSSEAAAGLTCALELVAEAQRGEIAGVQGAPAGCVAWIATDRSLFFPPDAVRMGVALELLVLLRVKDAVDQVRAATHLARSGGFRLLVVDLADPASPERRSRSWRSSRRSDVPPLSTLSSLAEQLRNPVIFLTGTRPDAASLDPRVKMRIAASRIGSGLVLTVLNEKGGFRRPPGFRFEEKLDAPAGLR